MTKLTPEDLEYNYCWHCMAKYAICPHCNGNSCACSCFQEEKKCEISGFWDVEWTHSKIPTKEQLIERYNWFLSLSKEFLEDEHKWILSSHVSEQYYYVVKFASDYGIEVLSYKEYCQLKNINTKSELKTVDQWIQEINKNNLDRKISDEKLDLLHKIFGPEEIPWIVFVYRAFY